MAPTSIFFGSVDAGTTSAAIAAVVTNTGSAPFGPINMFGGAPPTGEFGASQNCQATTLPAGGSCQITYTFSPTAAGQVTDCSSFTISPASSQTDGFDFTITLSGGT